MFGQYHTHPLEGRSAVAAATTCSTCRPHGLGLAHEFKLISTADGTDGESGGDPRDFVDSRPLRSHCAHSATLCGASIRDSFAGPLPPGTTSMYSTSESLRIKQRPLRRPETFVASGDPPSLPGTPGICEFRWVVGVELRE